MNAKLNHLAINSEEAHVIVVAQGDEIVQPIGFARCILPQNLYADGIHENID